MEPTDIEPDAAGAGRRRGGVSPAGAAPPGAAAAVLRRPARGPLPAEDFAQETFLRLWVSRERYQPTGRFSTYLFQIGKHYWLNQCNKFQARAYAESEPF